MKPIEVIFTRWKGILRAKAEQYEHPARKSGKEVFSPSIDDVCNEMDAFIAGASLLRTEDRDNG